MLQRSGGSHSAPVLLAADTPLLASPAWSSPSAKDRISEAQACLNGNELDRVFGLDAQVACFQKDGTGSQWVFH
jgi:hypothetical protein